MKSYITDRLIIREISETDFSDIAEYGSDSETAQYMLHWPKKEDEIRDFIQSRMIEMKNERPIDLEFVLQQKDTLKVIGNISIHREIGTGEIGWISNKKIWNRGYMSEGLRELVRHLRNDYGIQKIYATCTEKNIASYKVMEKIGMKLTEREADKEGIKQGERVLYTKLKYEMELALGSL